ncbi:zinc finger protein 70-like isoform X2 [Pleurodeles waltl]|uniref:zinc finger protein 70-like isoform X2 n=1 Tax=Pleurodeles waltl TaxID=8319 RepID=UPI0037098BF0
MEQRLIRASSRCLEIAAGFSEDELEPFEEKIEMDYQNIDLKATDNSIPSPKEYALVSKSSSLLAIKQEDHTEFDALQESETKNKPTSDPVFNPHSLLWIKEVEDSEVCDHDEAQDRRNSGSPSNPVYNPDIVSAIKQEEDSDFMETEDSDDSDCSEEREHFQYTTRKTSGPQPMKNRLIKEEIRCSDIKKTDREITLTSSYRKPGPKQMKEKERSSEEPADQGTDKAISCEQQRMPQDCKGFVSEYILDRISIYETGFCVINDPFVMMETQSGDSGKPKLYKCNKCGICFRNSDQLGLHMVVHRGEKSTIETISTEKEIQFSCPECKKRFLENSMLVDHMKVHSKRLRSDSEHTMPAKCKKTHIDVMEANKKVINPKETQHRYKECGSRLNANSKLENHVVFYPVRQPYACTECVRCFFRKSDLIRHLQKHTETNQEPIICEDTSFNSSSPTKKEACNTEVFGDIIHNEKHACDRCERTFSYRSSLLSHQRTHGDRPYVCSECGRGFIHISTLYKHQLTHTNPPEKPHQCSECGERFEHTYSLAKHRKTHIIDRPYQCYECERSFTQNANLIRHQKTHREEKRNSARLQHLANVQKEGVAKKEIWDFISPGEFNVKHPRTADPNNILKDMPLGSTHQRTQVIEANGGTSRGDITAPTRYQETHHRVIDFDEIFIDMELHSKENVFNTPIASVKEQKLEQWFTCSNCGQRFSEHFLLIKHERIHI